MFSCKCLPPLLAPKSSGFPSSILLPNLTIALLYLYISGGIAQLTENHDSLPYFGKMLAYS